MTQSTAVFIGENNPPRNKQHHRALEHKNTEPARSLEHDIIGSGAQQSSGTAESARLSRGKSHRVTARLLPACLSFSLSRELGASDVYCHYITRGQPVLPARSELFSPPFLCCCCCCCRRAADGGNVAGAVCTPPPPPAPFFPGGRGEGGFSRRVKNQPAGGIMESLGAVAAAGR